MTGRGVDGVLYSFVVTPRKAISLILPVGDEISHGKKKPFGDGDFTESGYSKKLRNSTELRSRIKTKQKCLSNFRFHACYG